MPKDFNFSLTYGAYGKKKIDTFNDIIIKDLVEEGTIEASIVLTEEEMRSIYKEMMSIHIMDELDLDKDKECDAEPSSISVWKVQMDGETKSFYHKTYCDYPEDVKNLLKLENYIHGIIVGKEEYERLPEINGSYALRKIRIL
ncbi:hypothetical protein ACOI1C_18280 [Bacillus sp. DJP31]|uniref:hypothetical protein n=1 Tax=Bacillus sp. DJP31 TaxID=3409789 RepID=UPI003BB6098C